MADKVGDIYVALALKNAAFVKGWTDSENLMKKKSQAMLASATQLSIGLTAPLTLIGKASIDEFRKFDLAMTRSTAIMDNMTAKVRSNMEEQARVLSLEGAKSATELAESYYFLASAGLDANESMTTLPTTLKFATAGVIDLDKAVSLLVRSQNGLGMASTTTAERMQSLERVASVLLKANTLADASTEQFATALTNKAAPALRLVNKEIEEGVAVLAVFAKQGVVGAKAGTFLDIALRELRIKAEKNKDEFKALGVEVFDTYGNMNHMADIVEDLEQALGGMSTEAKTAELVTLGFSQRSVFAIQSLMGFSTEIRKNETALKSVGGILDKVSKDQLKSFDAQIGMLGHKMDYIQKEIGEEFVPVVGHMNEAMKTAIVLWNRLDDETKEALVTYGSVAAVVGPILGLIGGMGLLAIHLKSAIGLLSMFAAKLAIAGASAAAIVAVFDFFLTNDFGNKFDQLGLDISTSWNLMMIDMGEKAALFILDLDSGWAQIKGGAIRAGSVIADELRSIFSTIIDQAESAWYQLQQLINKDNPLTASKNAQKSTGFARSRLSDVGVNASNIAGRPANEQYNYLQGMGMSKPEISEALSRAQDYNIALVMQARTHADTMKTIREAKADTEATLEKNKQSAEFISTAAHNSRMEVLNKDYAEANIIFGKADPNASKTFADHLAKRILQFQEKVKEFGVINKKEWADLVKDVDSSMDSQVDIHAAGMDQMKVDSQSFTEANADYFKEMHKGIEEGFTSAWETMFTSMMEGTATLQDAFQALGIELLKVVAQQALIEPLSSSFGSSGADSVVGLLGSIGGMFGGASTGINAAGGVGTASYGPAMFADGGAFGSGGVLTSPTPFSMGGGKMGVAGEAGPEAALPLSRMANGKLGVETSGGGSKNITQNFNITTPDADSFRRSSSQISKRMRNL